MAKTRLRSYRKLKLASMLVTILLATIGLATLAVQRACNLVHEHFDY